MTSRQLLILMMRRNDPFFVLLYWWKIRHLSTHELVRFYMAKHKGKEPVCRENFMDAVPVMLDALKNIAEMDVCYPGHICSDCLKMKTIALLALSVLEKGTPTSDFPLFTSAIIKALETGDTAK